MRMARYSSEFFAQKFFSSEFKWANIYLRDHVTELNNVRPKQPFFFSKPPSSILLPSSGPFLRPRGARVNYEVELGLVIGRTVRDLHEDDHKGALDAIQGQYPFLYTILVLKVVVF